MTTAENYIAYFMCNDKTLTIHFNNVTYNGQTNYLFDNNITKNILTINLDAIYNESIINETDEVTFVILDMYISPYNNKFLLQLYSEEIYQVNIKYPRGVLTYTTFSFNIVDVYLLEDLNDLSLSENKYYINPKDANDIFIIENDELYLKLNSYTFTTNEIIDSIKMINCMLDNTLNNEFFTLVIKGEIPAKIIDYLPVKDKKFKVYANGDKNNIIETKLYFNYGLFTPINNVTPIPNENDSFIDFRNIMLTEERKQSDYKIIRSENQVFNFTFKGYRGNQIVPSIEEIEPIKDVEIEDIGYYTVLVITFEKGTPGFLGITQEVGLPQIGLKETIVIYLNEEMSAKVDNDVTKIKFVVEDMKAIVPDTEEDSVNLNLNFYINGTSDGPTYIAVYYLNQYGTYSISALPIDNFEQEITKLNVIYGTIKENNGNKLFVPAKVNDIWNKPKLNLKRIQTNGTNLNIIDVQTTNCLIRDKLNLVVQGKIPIEWYNWLPLDDVYVSTHGTIYVNPESHSHLIKLESINALPSNDIGIDTSVLSELDLSGIDLETGEPLENN